MPSEGRDSLKVDHSLLPLLDSSGSVYSRQRERGFAWLRFEPALEAAYREFNYASFRRTRRAALLLLTLTLLAFLVFDLWHTRHVQMPLSNGLIIGARLLAIGVAGFATWRLGRDPDVRSGERWMPAALMTTSLMTLLVMLIYADPAFQLPLLLEGVVLVFISIFFPVGCSFWGSVMQAGVTALLAWTVTPLVVNAAMRHDFFALLPFQLTSLVALAAMRYYQEHAMRAQFLMKGALHEMASTDGLTGLSNRRVFEWVVQQALRQAAREKKVTALMLIDVDHFKKYNDRYGHPAGDETLKCVAQALGRLPLRPLDLAARVGGEEFALFFYDVDDDFARRTGSAACQDIERMLAIPHAESSAAPVVTLSIGIVMSKAGDDLEWLYKRADEALYQAKAMGRNRACLAG